MADMVQRLQGTKLRLIWPCKEDEDNEISINLPEMQTRICI